MMQVGRLDPPNVLERVSGRRLMPLHVVLNALFLDPPMGGVETYVRQLCAALLKRSDAPRITVLANPAGAAALASDEWASAASVVPCPRLGRAGLRAVSELGPVGALVDRLRADVVHSPAMTGPLASRAARVVTVPDTIWITHPEPGLTHRLWRVLVPRVAARAHRVVAISHAAAGDLRRHLGVPADRIDVVPLGFGAPAVAPLPADEVRRALGLGNGPIVLNVGQKKPHRNLEGLVRAVAAVRADVPDVRLVLPGPPNPAAEGRLRAYAAEHGIADAVVLPGFVDAPLLEGLYAAARAFVLPSFVEGFGLPVLEAMARGTAVACSADSAPGEVAGDAGLLFDPQSDVGIAEAIRALLRDDALHARLVAAGRVQAATYSWDRCAAQTLDTYAHALDARGRR